MSLIFFVSLSYIIFSLPECPRPHPGTGLLRLAGAGGNVKGRIEQQQLQATVVGGRPPREAGAAPGRSCGSAATGI